MSSKNVYRIIMIMIMIISDNISTSSDSYALLDSIYNVEIKLLSSKEQEIMICNEFELLEIWKKLRLFSKTVEKQLLYMNNVEVTYLINKVNEISENYRQRLVKSRFNFAEFIQKKYQYLPIK